MEQVVGPWATFWRRWMEGTGGGNVLELRRTPHPQK